MTSDKQGADCGAWTLRKAGFLLVRLVGFNGTPTPLPEGEIEKLMAGPGCGVRAVPDSYLKVGRRVRITCGPLKGLGGILIRKKNGLWFVISIELIQRSILLGIEASSVEPVVGRSEA